jgi:uncharacterized protein (TIGR00251 family)
MSAEIAQAVEQAQDGVVIRVWVVPGARVAGAAGAVEGYLRMHIRSRPERGKANAELLDVLAEALGLTRRELELVSGATSRRKVVFARHIDRQTAIDRLEIWAKA